MTEAVQGEQSQEAPEADPTPESEAATGEVDAKEESRVGYKLRQAEKELAATRAHSDATAQENAQWKQWWQAEGQSLAQQAQQRQQQGQQANGAMAADPQEELIKNELGRDEAGEKAYNTLESHFEHKMEKKGLMTAGNVERMIDERFGRFTTQLQSGAATSNKVQNWVQSGMMSRDHAQSLQNKANAVVQANPRLRDEPTNMAFLLDSLMAHSLAEKEFVPYQQPRPEATNPLVPGGGGGAPTKLPEWKAENTRFQSLRGLKANDVKKLDDESVRRHSQGAPT
jgi:hypothetical protein